MSELACLYLDTSAVSVSGFCEFWQNSLSIYITHCAAAANAYYLQHATLGSAAIKQHLPRALQDAPVNTIPYRKKSQL